MITIIFHKLLHKYTNNIDKFCMEVETYTDLAKGLALNFPKLNDVFKNILNRKSQGIILLDNNKKIIKEFELYKQEINYDTLYLVPSVIGSGKGAKSLIGVAAIMMAIAIPYFAGAGFGASTGFGAVKDALGAASMFQSWQAFAAKSLLSLGMNLILGTLMESLSPKPKKQENQQAESDDQRKNNDYFDGLNNTIDSSQLIALNYGLIRVPGQFVSGYVKNINHNKNDTVKVSSYV